MSLTTSSPRRSRVDVTKTPVKSCAPGCEHWSAKNSSTKPISPRYARLLMKATRAASPKATSSAASVSPSSFPCPANRGKFRFSRRAEADLLSIAGYTLREWGKAQTTRYIDELEDCCQMLADNPALGRVCDDVRPGVHRHEHGKHVLFYREERGGILISRILHQRMLPEKHTLDDQDDQP